MVSVIGERHVAAIGFGAAEGNAYGLYAVVVVPALRLPYGATEPFYRRVRDDREHAEAIRPGPRTAAVEGAPEIHLLPPTEYLPIEILIVHGEPVP